MAVGVIWYWVDGNTLRLTDDPGLSSNYTKLDQNTSTAVPWSGSLSSLTSIVINNTIQPIRTDRWFMGFGGSNISNVRYIDMSNCTSARQMFSSCSNLLYLPNINWDVSNVTDMYRMFYNCSSLNLASSGTNIANWDVSNVTSFEEMFYNDSSLGSLPVGNWDTSSATTMKGMFSNCSNITALDVSNFDTSSVTDMSQMFQNVNAALDVSNFDTSNVTSFYRMF